MRHSPELAIYVRDLCETEAREWAKIVALDFHLHVHIEGAPFTKVGFTDGGPWPDCVTFAGSAAAALDRETLI